MSVDETLKQLRNIFNELDVDQKSTYILKVRAYVEKTKSKEVFAFYKECVEQYKAELRERSNKSDSKTTKVEQKPLKEVISAANANGEESGDSKPVQDLVAAQKQREEDFQKAKEAAVKRAREQLAAKKAKEAATTAKAKEELNAQRVMLEEQEKNKVINKEETLAEERVKEVLKPKPKQVDNSEQENQNNAISSSDVEVKTVNPDGSLNDVNDKQKLKELFKASYSAPSKKPKAKNATKNINNIIEGISAVSDDDLEFIAPPEEKVPFEHNFVADEKTQKDIAVEPDYSFEVLEDGEVSKSHILQKDDEFIEDVEASTKPTPEEDDYTFSLNDNLLNEDIVNEEVEEELIPIQEDFVVEEQELLPTFDLSEEILNESSPFSSFKLGDEVVAEEKPTYSVADNSSENVVSFDSSVSDSNNVDYDVLDSSDMAEFDALNAELGDLDFMEDGHLDNNNPNLEQSISFNDEILEEKSYQPSNIDMKAEGLEPRAVANVDMNDDILEDKPYQPSNVDMKAEGLEPRMVTSVDMKDDIVSDKPYEPSNVDMKAEGLEPRVVTSVDMKDDIVSDKPYEPSNVDMKAEGLEPRAVTSVDMKDDIVSDKPYTPQSGNMKDSIVSDKSSYTPQSRSMKDGILDDRARSVSSINMRDGVLESSQPRPYSTAKDSALATDISSLEDHVSESSPAKEKANSNVVPFLSVVPNNTENFDSETEKDEVISEPVLEKEVQEETSEPVLEKEVQEETSKSVLEKEVEEEILEPVLEKKETSESLLEEVKEEISEPVLEKEEAKEEISESVLEKEETADKAGGKVETKGISEAKNVEDKSSLDDTVNLSSDDENKDIVAKDNDVVEDISVTKTNIPAPISKSKRFENEKEEPTGYIGNSEGENSSNDSNTDFSMLLENTMFLPDKYSTGQNDNSVYDINKANSKEQVEDILNYFDNGGIISNPEEAEDFFEFNLDLEEVMTERIAEYIAHGYRISNRKSLQAQLRRKLKNSLIPKTCVTIVLLTALGVVEYNIMSQGYELYISFIAMGVFFIFILITLLSNSANFKYVSLKITPSGALSETGYTIDKLLRSPANSAMSVEEERFYLNKSKMYAARFNNELKKVLDRPLIEEKLAEFGRVANTVVKTGSYSKVTLLGVNGTWKHAYNVFVWLKHSNLVYSTYSVYKDIFALNSLVGVEGMFSHKSFDEVAEIIEKWGDFECTPFQNSLKIDPSYTLTKVDDVAKLYNNIDKHTNSSSEANNMKNKLSILFADENEDVENINPDANEFTTNKATVLTIKDFGGKKVELLFAYKDFDALNNMIGRQFKK